MPGRARQNIEAVGSGSHIDNGGFRIGLPVAGLEFGDSSPRPQQIRHAPQYASTLRAGQCRPVALRRCALRTARRHHDAVDRKTGEFFAGRWMKCAAPPTPHRPALAHGTVPERSEYLEFILLYINY